MAHGTFILADIGGYTAFLSDVGIEHAKEITSHLFNGMVDLEPDRWKVGNVVGDCLFLYTDSGCCEDEVLDHVLGLYDQFLDSISEVMGGSTCGCGACDRTGDLALKFVVHCGEFDVHDVAGRVELIGPDIVVAHRLLKNEVPAREYVLITKPMADQLTDQELNTVAGSDTFDDVGTIDYRYVDLAPYREYYHRRHKVLLTPAEADVVSLVEIAAPVDEVWQVAVDNTRGPEWAPTLERVDHLSGPTEGAGAVHTCLHGDGAKYVHHTVFFDPENHRWTDRIFGVPVIGEMYQTWVCEEIDDGTRFGFLYGIRPGAADYDDELRALFIEVMQAHADLDVAGMKQVVEAARGGD